MSNKLAEKKKSFSFIPSILKEFERNSRLCNDVVSSWSKNLNRSTEDGKVKLNIRSETDIQRQAMRKVTHQKSLSTGRNIVESIRRFRQDAGRLNSARVVSQRHWVVLTKKIRQPEHMIE